MLIKKFKNCKEITAGDNSILREFLNCHVDKVESRYSLAWAFKFLCIVDPAWRKEDEVV